MTGGPGDEAGQATIEVIAGLPLLLLAGVVASSCCSPATR